MLKKVLLGLLCILFAILDNSLMPVFSIKGVYPSLLFTFIILFSMINGYWDAIFLGVVAGILQDVYFMHGFGTNSLINLNLCIIAAYIGENILKQKRLVPVVSALVFTIAKVTVLYVFSIIFGFSIILSASIGIGIYNLIVALFMYSWVYKFSNKDFMKHQWNFSEK